MTRSGNIPCEGHERRRTQYVPCVVVVFLSVQPGMRMLQDVICWFHCRHLGHDILTAFQPFVYFMHTK